MTSVNAEICPTIISPSDTGSDGFGARKSRAPTRKRDGQNIPSPAELARWERNSKELFIHRDPGAERARDPGNIVISISSVTPVRTGSKKNVSILKTRSLQKVSTNRKEKTEPANGLGIRGN
ncbi:MAG: hypothetical protein KDN19_12780 [Verrucomicrobiae bacterium]|nr:hypothetical protein [Verrucomicrobiae bacterium]